MVTWGYGCAHAIPKVRMGKHTYRVTALHVSVVPDGGVDRGVLIHNLHYGIRLLLLLMLKDGRIRHQFNGHPRWNLINIFMPRPADEVVLLFIGHPVGRLSLVLICAPLSCCAI